MQLESKFRQAEALVADESKDDYYNAHKPKIEGFKISKVEFLDGGKRARVITLTKTTVTFAGAPTQQFEIPALSSWKLIDGKWYWYMDRDLLKQTPFGTAKEGEKSNGTPPAFSMPGSAPSIEKLQQGVQISRNIVDLEPGGPAQTVTLINNLPGVAVVKLGYRTVPIPGLVVEPQTVTINGNSKAELKLRAEKGAKLVAEQIVLEVSPLNQNFVIQLKTVEKQ